MRVLRHWQIHMAEQLQLARSAVQNIKSPDDLINALIVIIQYDCQLISKQLISALYNKIPDVCHIPMAMTLDTILDLKLT